MGISNWKDINQQEQARTRVAGMLEPRFQGPVSHICMYPDLVIVSIWPGGSCAQCSRIVIATERDARDGSSQIGSPDG